MTASPSSSSSSDDNDSDSPRRVQPFRRRIRHLHTIAVHNLTLTPHRDELLGRATTEDLAALREDGLGRRRAVDDLELVSSGRRRRLSGSNFLSSKPHPSSPTAARSPTSPTTLFPSSIPPPSPSAVGTSLPSTSASLPMRRPSFTRARASSRLSASPALISGRPRSSSRASVGSNGSERTVHLRGTGSLREEGTITEDVGEGTSSSAAELLEMDKDDSDVTLKAKERLLRSFVTLRVCDEAAERLKIQPEAGPLRATTSPKESSSSVAPSLTSDAPGMKGKGRADSPRLSSASCASLSRNSSSSLSRPRSASSVRSPASSRPTSPPTSRLSLSIDSSSQNLTSPENATSSRPSRSSGADAHTLPRAAMSISNSSDGPSFPSASTSPGASTIRAQQIRRPRPHSMFSSPSIPTPPISSSFIPSQPWSPPNPERTPFYVSPLHAPSTNPRFAGIDAESDFGPWDRRIWREEKVVLQIWVDKAPLKAGTGTAEPSSTVASSGGNDEGWRVLREIEIDLAKLKKWNGKSPLAPNTVLLSFSSSPDDFYYASSTPSRAKPTNSTFERTLSDGELDAPRTGPHRRRRREKEWSGEGDLYERSLRETRMKKSIGFGELLRLVNLGSVLSDTERSAMELRGKLDVALDAAEGRRLARGVSEKQGAIRHLEAEQAKVEAESSQLEHTIATLRGTLQKRQATLLRGEDMLAFAREETEQLERSVTEKRNQRKSLLPHFETQRAKLSADLARIFPLVPTANSRSLLFSILDVPLPIPTNPKEPAPPLHLPPSELPPGLVFDEETVATALGYAAMVVSRLAVYLGRPLPYPLTCAGSRSLVKDPISVMHGPTRMFPLYSKGIEKYRFEYAVFLLNKNVEMLMADRDIRVLDIRHTLPNLTLLLTVSSHPKDEPSEARRPSCPRPSPTATATASASAFPHNGGEPHASGQDDPIVLDDSDPEESQATTPKASGLTSRSSIPFWGRGTIRAVAAPLVALEKSKKGAGVAEGGDEAASPKAAVVGTTPAPTTDGGMVRPRRGTIARAFGGQGGGPRQ